MTDPQTAADAAERCPNCAATAPYWRPDDRECEICLAITEVPGTLDELASDAEDGYGAAVIGEHVTHLRQKHALLVEHVGTLLAERARTAAELEQVHNASAALTAANAAAQEVRAYLGMPVTPKWFSRELVRELLAEHDALLADRARLTEEYALCRLGLVSDDPREHWTGPGANGAAEAAAWELRATHNANVTVARRCATPWSMAATTAETTATRPADGPDAEGAEKGPESPAEALP